MPASSSTLRTLNRIAERAASLVYFVGENNELGFANRATADWLECEPGDLKSVRLDYAPADRATETGAPSLNGLCPPPEICGTDAPPMLSFVISRIDSNSNGSAEIRFCRAAAVRLIDGSGLLGILVVADPTSETGSAAALASDEAADQQPWHALLASLRAQWNASFSPDSVVGMTPFAKRLQRQIRLASESRADVLIHGPVGCGKEHLARSIYAAACQPSDLPDGDLNIAPIHCPIADPPLIQQRIADARRSRASGHPDSLVLLLLDVDQLSTESQAELLGFLDLPSLQVRTLATASTSLIGAGNSSTYHPRLAHRLETLSIEMVALRQRTDDIPLLAQAFLERGNASRPRQLSGFSEAAIERLTEFDWPENLNQLKRVVEAAADQATAAVITENDLPVDFQHALQAMRVGQPESVTLQLDAYLAEIETELLDRALQQTRGNKTQAAKSLGISRPRLLRRLEQLGLDHYLQPITPRDNDQLDESAFEELTE